ncbi:DUF1223 domain-containing protein [Hymenobacter sp. 15J16-1T3B]|uniref:DUF1223 domain-containing protein n=1 Tax=Hymenobacter sp. 15J16-1T3B TaxID=2886941 RepID=UPI001D123F8A|nr:DUF1223 domain-containing protein [Hymenobacter sp. 15J16-1T3B]MCC3159751.1 DUF1223 domain-containing protein [Hymenobacter sp. 15J16-1T3B]
MLRAALSLSAAALLALTFRPAPKPSTTPPRAAAARVPVVVELFTSEGCSSCPAADEVLRELARTQPVPGVEVLALGQHVDYWNRLGWKDAFSAPQFTERQRDYARHFGTNSYTPQAVVNGRYELVGSQRSRLLATITQAAQEAPATVALTRTAGHLQVRVDQLPAGTAAATVLLALTETGLSSLVGRGENAGRLLRHAAVVRTLRPLGPVGPDGRFTATVPLTLAAGWQPAQLQAVVLVQEEASRRIVGAGWLPLAAD